MHHTHGTHCIRRGIICTQGAGMRTLCFDALTCCVCVCVCVQSFSTTALDTLAEVWQEGQGTVTSTLDYPPIEEVWPNGKAHTHTHTHTHTHSVSRHGARRHTLCRHASLDTHVTVKRRMKRKARCGVRRKACNGGKHCAALACALCR